MHSFIVGQQEITYCLIYQNRRKTVQLKFVNEHCLQITVPARLPRDEIEQLLLSKSKWIIEKKGQLDRYAACTLNKSTTPGAQVLFLGEPYTIEWTNGLSPNVNLHSRDKRIVLTLSGKTQAERLAQANLCLKTWYLTHAKKHLASKTAFWAKHLAVKPQKITLRDQKSRWGSCSSLGNINYNWRIIMAPLEIMDYLVIHELAHLRFPNHSKAFWFEVQRFCPEFSQHRLWLKDRGRILMTLFRDETC
jgi:predicted metal-dependent hydrolase